jgi:hypothetical protein
MFEKPIDNRQGVITMGTGHYAQYADTVEERLVRELCPQEYNAFLEYLQEHDGDLTVLAIALHWSHEDWKGIRWDSLEWDFDGDVQTVETLFNSLKTAFEKATTVGDKGLRLSFVYHEAENRGDELNGYAWEVGNVYQWSPAGEKFHQHITRLFWTNFG